MEDRKLTNLLVKVNCEYHYTIGVLEGVFQMVGVEKLEDLNLLDTFDEIFKRYEKLTEDFNKLVESE